VLILLTGRSGSGKTAAAAILEFKLPHAVRLSSDAIRPELVEEPRYSDIERMVVYDELLRRAKEFHRAGGNVILDATFNTAELRRKVRAIGPMLTVWMRCPVDVSQKRRHNKGLPPELYEEPTDADLVLDTDKLTPEECAARVTERIRGA
jgi:predicted kinase